MKNIGAFINSFSPLLVKHGFLKHEDVEQIHKAFASQPAQTYQEFLLNEQFLTKEQLLALLSEYYGIAAVDVSTELFDPRIVKMFHHDFLQKYNALPYKRDDQVLLVVTGDPSQEDLYEVFGDNVSYDLEFFVGIPHHIDLVCSDIFDQTGYRMTQEEIIDEIEREREEYDGYKDSDIISEE